MEHTEIPILLALLSCCVWKNVEVRTTPCVSGNGAMVFCSIWISKKCTFRGKPRFWLADGAQLFSYPISMSLTSIHVRGSFIFCKCMIQLCPLTTKSHRTHPRHKGSDGTGRLGRISANTYGSCAPEASLRVCDRDFGLAASSLGLHRAWKCLARCWDGEQIPARRVPTGLEEIPLKMSAAALEQAVSHEWPVKGFGFEPPSGVILF